MEKSFLRKVLIIKLSYLSLSIAVNALILFIAMLVSGESFDDWIRVFTFISLFQLVFNIIALKVLGEEIFSLSNLFLIFSYLFHFGHVVLFFLQVDLDHQNVLITNSVSAELLKKASEFTLFVQAFVAIGMMVNFIKPLKLDVAAHYPIGRNQVAHYMGIICVLIGLGPMIYIDITKVMAFLQNGYLATFELEVSNIYILARLTIVGIMLIIVANRESTKLATILVAITVLYEVFSMFSGGRGKAVVTILATIYLYTKVIKKVRLRIFLTYFVFGYFLINIINTIREFRLTSGDINSFVRILSNQNLFNPFIDIVYEFGGTMLTVCFSILYFPQHVPIQWGTNYLFSVFTWLPSSIGNLEYFIDKVQYITFFPGTTEKFMGGSYIGELYYSFNLYGIGMAIFVGLFISFISRKIREGIVFYSPLRIVLGIILFSNMLWWVRDYFGSMLREVFWIALFLFGLKLIVTYFVYRKNYPV